jgi:hypothetical protein
MIGTYTFPVACHIIVHVTVGAHFVRLPFLVLRSSDRQGKVAGHEILRSGLFSYQCEKHETEAFVRRRFDCFLHGDLLRFR